MKDILLITNYWHFETEKASSRYRTLAEMISEAGMDLEVITSSFYHMKKEQRNYSCEYLNSFSYQVTLIHEGGYSKNISLKRIGSHKEFARNVIAYLKNRKKPDAVYVVIPSLDVADVVSKWASDNKIPFILDIQDLWPEAFGMAVSPKILANLLFAPMKRKANAIYARADKIVAVSETYVQRGLSQNRKDKSGLSVYIGTDLDYANLCIEQCPAIKPENEFWVTYIGALGHSYDIKLIIDALKLTKNDGIKNIVFKIMGSGVLMDEFKEYAELQGVKCEFLGQTEYAKMMGILAASDIAVNPIAGKSVASIINKVADYAAAGVPVVNTQNNQEYRALLVRYHAGINCTSNSAEEAAQAIKQLYHDKALREKMQQGSKVLGTEQFDRRATYKKIVSLIEDISVRTSVSMGKFEVLCATMHQKDFSKIQEMNLQTDVVFANQADYFGYEEYEFDGHMARMITTSHRGVGKNRNLALLYSTADICLLADDDMRYVDGYEKIIVDAFQEVQDADILIFNVDLASGPKERKLRNYNNVGRIHSWSRLSFGTYRVAFRMNSVKRGNVWFNQLFGGGCIYPAGEDTLWLKDALKAGLKIYVHPAVIGSVDQSRSTWFTGFNDKLFFGKGAYYQRSSPKLKYLWMAYFSVRSRKLSNLPLLHKIKWMNNGAKGYKKNLSYDEWTNKV